MMLENALAPLWEVLPQWRSLRKIAIDTFDCHGHASGWRRALAQLPDATPSHADLGDVVTIGRAEDLQPSTSLRSALAALHPWRKGPFDFFGVAVDAEWRSNLKWERLVPHLTPLTGRRVLDVGSGNGYHGWRMRSHGAALVVGIEANPGHVAQHLAASRYLGGPVGSNYVVPVRFEQIPPTVAFDTVFSMGVLYHQRDPVGHLARLREFVGADGELVLETLIVDGEPLVLGDEGRYARMRNVHCVPTTAMLSEWLAQVGFTDIRIVDVTATTTDEQRRTEWMRFESLAEALDPADPNRTVEGHPAPRRAIVIAS